MDEEISKWILEFLLRQKLDDKIINGVLSSLPLKDEDNHRLKKTLLLRRIESEASNGFVSEKLLDWLEIIEELDHRERKSASESMKKAYCAVAVDCTVRVLDENVENNAKYLEAVKRVWRERVCKIEGLASEESKQRLGEIEAAVWDADACAKLLMMNTRYVALKSIRVYLAEAWGSLGPTFLELVAEKAGNALEELRAGGGGSTPVGPVANPCRDLPANGETPKAQVRRRKHIAMKCKRGKGAKISDANEGNEDEFMGNANDNSAPQVEKVTAPIKPSSMETDATKKVNPPTDPQTTQTLPSTKATDNINSETNVTNLENERHPEMLATPEVNRIQEQLKSSLIELRAVVKDPLPDALKAAETLCSTLAANNRSSSSSEPVVVKERGPKIHAPGENSETGVENAERENPTRDPPGNEAEQQQMKLRNAKRSLMEPNGTAHTYEWDDSTDNLSGGSSKRPRLPSPNESKPPSPLKGYEDTKFSKRRMRRKWTPLEEDSLRTGVQKFGKGNWKLIRLSYREILGDRTEVDLKDKWRNMTR